MPIRGPGQNSPMSVRQKAEQDLASLRTRLAEAERQTMQLKIEERELNTFLKRLSRYEVEESSGDHIGGPRVPSLRYRLPEAPPSQPTSNTIAPSIPRENSRRGIVNREALDYLKLIKSPATTLEIVNYIRNEKSAFPFLGMNPVGTLSSYLSRDPRFSFDKSEGGWMTVEFEEIETDQGGDDLRDKQGKGEAL